MRKITGRNLSHIFKIENMKSVTKFILGILAIGLIACENDEPATQALGDSFIVAKTVDQETVYGIVHHAYTNKSFTKVSATSTEDANATYELTSSGATSNEFFYETEADDYTSTIPQTGTYTFNATIIGNEAVAFSDNLTDKLIAPPTIEECIYDDTDNRIELEWTEDTEVDIYNLRIYDDADKMVFSSAGFDDDDQRVNITTSTSGWLSNFTPTDDKTYTVELNAYKYEAVKSDMNLQCKSTSKHNIVWNP